MEPELAPHEQKGVAFEPSGLSLHSQEKMSQTQAKGFVFPASLYTKERLRAAV